MTGLRAERLRAHKPQPRLIWAILALALALNACQGPDTSADQHIDPALPEGALRVETSGQRGGTLLYSLVGEPRSFNPLLGDDYRTKLVGQMIHATLLEWSSETQSAVAGVVESWRLSEDGLSLTLKLRRGLKFSDGQPMTVDDVLFTLESIVDPQSATSLKDVLLYPGQSLNFSALSDEEVLLRLALPDASLEYFLTLVPVLPKHLLADSGSDGLERAWTLDTNPKEIAGLGPFLLTSHHPGRRTVFDRNPHYWRVDTNDLRLPYFDRLEIRYVVDANTQVLRLQAGELDLIDLGLRPENFNLLVQSSEGLIAKNAGPSGRVCLLWFNLNLGVDPQGKPYLSPTKKRWFSDLAFRKAVDLAISRTEVARVAFLGQATPTVSIAVDSGGWAAPDLRPIQQDLKAARRVLSEAGYGWLSGGQGEFLIDSRKEEVRFEILTIPSMRAIAELVQHDLAELGMQVTLRQEEMNAVGSQALGARRYDSILAGFQFPSEPSGFANVLRSAGQMHLWNPNQTEPATGWERRIDHLLGLHRTTLDPALRREAFFEVQRILEAELPLLPVVFWDTLVAYRSSLRNIKPDATFVAPALWNVWELYREQ